MDGREAMASYHIYRGLGGGPGSGSHQQQQQQQPGLHGIRPISSSNPSPNPNLQVQQSSGIGGGGGGGGGGGSLGSGFQVESPPSLSHHGVSVGGIGGGGGGLAGAVGQAEPLKRKRGRPRKYGPDGSVSLALSPMSPPASGMAAVSGSGTPGKRGRGRPPGTGRKQLLASLGEWVVGSAGMGFTPHVITISVGEDIATKIMSFSQQGPRAVCILSANGAVSTVTLRQPATSGGTVTYEGRFEILSLSGSYFMTEDGGSRSRSGGLSISLSSPDGRVIGGGVGGLLIAANTVQVIVGSFIYGGLKQKGKMKAGQESVLEAEHQIGDKPSPPSSGLPLQNPSPVMEWPGSRQMDMRNPHIGIDLTRG